MINDSTTNTTVKIDPATNTKTNSKQTFCAEGNIFKVT